MDTCNVVSKAYKQFDKLVFLNTFFHNYKLIIIRLFIYVRDFISTIEIKPFNSL